MKDIQGATVTLSLEEFDKLRNNAMEYEKLEADQEEEERVNGPKLDAIWNSIWDAASCKDIDNKQWHIMQALKSMCDYFGEDFEKDHKEILKFAQGVKP